MTLEPQQNSVFIDPKNCGSFVGYHIHMDEYTPKGKPTRYSMSATVVLADCVHKIDWTFNEDDKIGQINKIDLAIGLLQEFRSQFIETEKLIVKLNKGAKERV